MGKPETSARPIVTLVTSGGALHQPVLAFLQDHELAFELVRPGLVSAAPRARMLVLLDGTPMDRANSIAELSAAHEVPFVILSLQETESSLPFRDELASARVFACRAPDDLARNRILRRSLFRELTRPTAIPTPPRPEQTMRPSNPPTPALKTAASPRFPIVLIGCSSGGPAALTEVLGGLSDTFQGAIVVSQHMPEKALASFAKRIDGTLSRRVIDVDAPQVLTPNTIYLAKGGGDCRFDTHANKLRVKPVPAQDGHPWHPAVDVMAASAQETLPLSRLICVLLTGIGNDGAKGFQALHALGVPTIAESKASASVFGMPARLIELRGASHVLHRKRIAAKIEEIAAELPQATRRLRART